MSTVTVCQRPQQRHSGVEREHKGTEDRNNVQGFVDTLMTHSKHLRFFGRYYDT